MSLTLYRQQIDNVFNQLTEDFLGRSGAAMCGAIGTAAAVPLSVVLQGMV